MNTNTSSRPIATIEHARPRRSARARRTTKGEQPVTDTIRAVPIGEMVVSDADDDVLVAYGLGSCIAICLYDPVARVGGMLHALLPATPDNPKRKKGNPAPAASPAKFVDQGTPLLIEALVKLGARRTRLTAQLCGGAQVLSAPGFEEEGILKIGKRNVQAAERALKAAGVQVKARDTGGRIGRTVRLYVASGQVTVKSLEQKEQVLYEQTTRGNV
jgi:chemotaxis protein CheD